MLSAFTPRVSPRTVSVTDRIQMEAASVAFVRAQGSKRGRWSGTTRTWRGTVRKVQVGKEVETRECARPREKEKVGQRRI